MTVRGLDCGDAVCVAHYPVRAGIKADGFYAALEPRGHLASVRAVVSDDELATLVRVRDESCELRERFDDRIERAVDIEVVRFDRADRCDRWSEIMERAVKLARLSDEQTGFATPPVLVCLFGDRGAPDPAADPLPGACERPVLELPACRADDDRWVELRVSQGAPEHRGCG